jgi:hypothetical protein
MKNNLESKIQEYYFKTLPEARDDRLEQLIDMAKLKMNHYESVDPSPSFLSFYLSQFSLIRKQVWILQFIIAIVFAIMFAGKQELSNVVGGMTTLIPLLFTTWTRELSRSFLYESAEVELSTRFTLRQVILSRMTIIGLIDLLIITITGAVASRVLLIEMTHVFIYLFVPFLFTAFGCLFFLNHMPAKGGESCCIGWSGGMMLIAFYLSHWETRIYDQTLIFGWYIAFFTALVLVIVECIVLLKNCSKEHYFRQTA